MFRISRNLVVVGWLLLLTVLTAGCNSIKVRTPVLNESNANVTGEELARIYGSSTYFASFSTPKVANAQPTDMYAVMNAGKADQRAPKALIARGWGSSVYVIYAKSLGGGNYIMQVSGQGRDGSVGHTLHRVTLYKDSAIAWDYTTNLEAIASADPSIASMGSGVDMKDGSLVFDEFASKKYADRILAFVGGLSTEKGLSAAMGRQFLPESDGEAVQAFWRRKEREDREEAAEAEKRDEDREPTEEEMTEAIRGTFAGALFQPSVTKLGNCRKAAPFDYYCRYRIVGTNWGNFWKSDGKWSFEIVK